MARAKVMTQGEYILFRNKQELEQRQKYLMEKLSDWDFNVPLAVKLLPYDPENPRSISQNALFHKWCREIVKGMQKKGFSVTEGDPAEAWKMWLKKRFLGCDDYRISKTQIQGQVKRTSNLSKGDMCFFMDQCYHWATEQGIRLTIPAESEYAELKTKQER